MKKIILGIIIGFVIVSFGGILINGIKNQEIIKQDDICKGKKTALEPIVKIFEAELNKRGELWGIQNTTELTDAFYSSKFSTCLGVFHIHLELAKTAKAEFIAKLFNYPTDKKDIYVIKNDKQESPLFTTDDKVKLDTWVKENK